MGYTNSFIIQTENSNLMIRLLFISLLFSCKGNVTKIVKKEAISYQKQVAELQSDSLLIGIQSKIYNAFVQSLMLKENKTLANLDMELENLNKKRKQNIILYWRSYLQFYYSIYYLKKGDKEVAEKEIDKGIDWLDEMKNKNS